ncbi:MAG: hypothetical protein J6K33_07535 [Alistipes sp.]|nr:hypothetical protein [Alistipes sp.]MBP3643483.1 hypothetical protein [Alistipes sp.]
MSKNEDKKKSFVMYDSFLEAMKHLNDAEFRECVLKIRDYALEGVDEESSSPMVNVIMELAKPNLDSAKRRYMASVENGKKGAEFGKLGGAPKGNQNARKNNPQSTPKQPLDVDVNDNVEVDENEEVNVEVDADAPSGSTAFQYSFSNSSNSSLTYEANESELLEEEEENNERNLGLDLKGLVFVPASEVEKEIHIYSKSESDNTPPVSPCSEKEPECSAARPQQQKDSGMDMSKYLEECIIKNATRLACLRKNALPQDDNLFWRTVGLYCDLYGDSKKDAARFLNKLISEQIRKGIV